MQSGSILHLPSKQLVTVPVGADGNTALFQGLPLSGGTYDWTGRLLTSNRLLTPVAMQRGMWLALHGLDPTLTGTINSSYYTNVWATSVTMRNAQYGTAWDTATYATKPPTTILYNMLLVKAPSASGNAMLTRSNYNSFAATAESMIGNATGLAAANAFVALTDPMGWDQTGGKFLAWPFPAASKVIVTETVNGNTYHNTTKVVDETQFVGGNLCVLSGFYVNLSGGTRNSGPAYCFVQVGNDHVTLTSDDVLSSLIATDMDVLRRCYGRFQRFSHYVYFWGSRTDTGSTTCANATFAHVQTIAAQAAAYGVTVRGLYTQGVTDITSVVQADVASFLNGL